MFCGFVLFCFVLFCCVCVCVCVCVVDLMRCCFCVLVLRVVGFGIAQENLSDVDDDIGDYLITEDAEVKAKESIWLSMNEDYLALQVHIHKSMHD
eukprot:COSAG05_NODE_872_length_6839_cov_16.232938_7_plen_95_part_00